MISCLSPATTNNKEIKTLSQINKAPLYSDLERQQQKSSYLITCVFSHPRRDPADLMPAQRGLCRDRQRIPRIHQPVLPPSLCGAASVWRMLQQ